MAEPSGPVTEIVILPLKADIDVNDSSSAAGKTWLDILATLAKQEGFLRSYYGLEIENPSVLNWFLDWTSLSAHKRYIADPSYGSLVEKINSLISGPLQFHHFEVHPGSQTITNEPSSYVSATQALLSSGNTIEVAHFHLVTDPSSYIPNVEKFINLVSEAKPDGYHGAFLGTVVEEIPVRGEENGKKGKAVVLAIAWETKEHHYRFRETETFKKDVKLLRDGRGGAEVHHVIFKTSPASS